MINSFLFFISSWVIASSAFAQDVIMTSATHSLKVSLVPLPSDVKGESYFLVAWDHLSSDPKLGGMIYRREGESTEHRYFAVGEGGLFSFFERGEKTLVNGTAIPIYHLVLDDPAHPIEMRVSPDHPKVEDLQSAYLSHEGFLAPSATKADVEKAFAQAAQNFQQRCGSKPSFQMQGFEQSNTGLASSAAAVAMGIADKCRDKDYKAAIAKIRTFKVSYNEGLKPSDLRFKHLGSSVEIVVGKEIMNPRERAEHWISQDL